MGHARVVGGRLARAGPHQGSGAGRRRTALRGRRCQRCDREQPRARNLDTVVPTAQALPGVVNAVDDAVPVLVDGGIRRGTDVAKALALGCDGGAGGTSGDLGPDRGRVLRGSPGWSRRCGASWRWRWDCWALPASPTCRRS